MVNKKKTLNKNNNDNSEENEEPIHSNLSDCLNMDTEFLVDKYIPSNITDIFDPVYEYYNAYYKISPSFIEYINDSSNLFIEHLKYINNNIDYLNLSNPDNYKEQFFVKKCQNTYTL